MYPYRKPQSYMQDYSDMIRCKHCRNEVPRANYTLHEARCGMMAQSRRSELHQNQPRSSAKKESSSRIPMFSPPNHQPKREYEESSNGSSRFRRSEVIPPEQVQVEVEETIPCSYCGYNQTLAELDTHPSQCPGREETCSDCGVGVPPGLMDDHRYVCQARTIPPEPSYQEEEEPDLFSNLERVMRQRMNHERMLQQRQREMRRRQQEMYAQEEDEMGSFGMMGMGPPGRVAIIETTDSMGNVLRRVVPTGSNVFGPTLGQRNNSFVNFLQLINMMAQREREPMDMDRGLTKDQIRGLSRIYYHSTGEKDLCTICYCDFEEDQKVISLRCKHLYHEQCIVKWLEKNAKCPVCKRPQTDREIPEGDE